MITISRRARKTLYNRWRKMVLRCSDPDHPDYHRYGGQGVHVVAEWQGHAGFENFLHFAANELKRPDTMTLDQVLFPANGGFPYQLDRFPDNNGPYAPNNVRWATPKLNSDNQRNRVWVAVAGVLHTRADAARAAGVDPRTASYRNRRGYTVEEATTLPVGGRTAGVRDLRDAVIIGMIEAGLIVVDRSGFVFVEGADGFRPVRVAPVSNGEYLGLSISIQPQFHALIPPDSLGRRRRAGKYRDGFLHHRVVALFHHRSPGGSYHEVDHVNGDKHDNRPENLRWRRPRGDFPGEGNRPGPRGRPVPPSSERVDYRDPRAEQRAWNAVLVENVDAAAAPVDAPGLLWNRTEEDVQNAAAVVRADAHFSGSIWSRGRFALILASVLRARANGLHWVDGRPFITCTDQSGRRVLQTAVVDISSSCRVFFGCTECGRGSRLRSEVRNRGAHRYGTAVCESCHALDRQNPQLAGLLAPDPATGVRPHASTVSAGSNRMVYFNCRVAGCGKVVLRQVKRLHREGILPVCDGHRRRGDNFAAASGAARSLPTCGAAPGESACNQDAPLECFNVNVLPYCRR